MTFWFSKKNSENLLIFDITAHSVAGAYVEITENTAPRFFYTKRVPVEISETTEPEEQLLAALGALSGALIAEGAPLKYRATKTGHVDTEMLSIGYPWQKNEIHTKTFDRGQDFIFTKEMRDYALEEIAPEKDWLSTGKLLLATLLNGYHIGNPIGKKVGRADLLMLSSSVNKEITEKLTKTLRKSFHQSQPHITALAPTIYFVMQDLYPHEEEVLIMNISRGITDIALVKKHLLVDVMNVAVGTEVCATTSTTQTDMLATPQILTDTYTEAEQTWISAISKIFSECSSRQGLPRTIFLLTEGDTGLCFKRLLDSKEIRALWLSDTKLNIVPLEEKHFASFVKMEGEAKQDLYLSLLALYYAKHKDLVL